MNSLKKRWLLDNIKNNRKKMFTYLSKEDASIPYLNLCLRSMKKHLPENYELEIITESRLPDFINYEFLPGPIEAMCSSPLFLSFLAASLLYQHGGIFVKPDTILTDKFIPDELLLEKYDLLLFYPGKKNEICSGYLMAQKGASVLEGFLSESKKHFEDNTEFSFSEYLRKNPCEKFVSMSAENSGYLMEQSMYGVYNEYIYRNYYFTDICSVDEFMSTTNGITALNREWTPEEYKKLGELDFLSKEILLARIFKKVLEL